MDNEPKAPLNVPPRPLEEVKERLQRFGKGRPAIEEPFDRFVVVRGGRIGPVRVRLFRYVVSIVDPARWLYAYELRAGEFGWEYQNGFLEEDVCRRIAHDRADTIDEQFIYKAIWQRRKAEEKRARLERSLQTHGPRFPNKTPRSHRHARR